MTALVALVSCGDAGASGREDAIASPPLPDPASVEWAVSLPGDRVASNGLADFDKAGHGPGGMAYPAPNVAGFVAAILAHAMVESATQRQQRTKLQTAADQVLAPYRGVIDGIGNQDLGSAALALRPFGERKHLATDAGPSASEWTVVSNPHFYFTQDQRAFVLDNAVSIIPPGGTAAIYRNVVRVVSGPGDEADPVARWTADDGRELRQAWASLFAESIDIALNDLQPATPAGAASFETVRYREGGSGRIERAQPLYTTCGRLVLRTLRKTLMSVPLASPPQPGHGYDSRACPHPETP